MSAPASAAPAAAAPAAPGFGELFEQSLLAVVDPSVFRRAAAGPAPSFGAAAGLALAGGAAALVIGIAHALVASPALLQQFSPATLAAAGVAGVGLYASLFLLLSVLLYGAGNAFGGKGEFERALQASAMIAALVPAQSLFNWFPVMWIAPAMLAAWVAANALEGLFHAKRGPVRGVCILLAGAAIGLQFMGRVFVDRARDAYSAAQAMTSAEAASAASMAALQQAASAVPPSPGAPSSPGAAPAVPVQAPTSGLDLLRGGLPEDGDGAAPAPAAAPSQAQTAAANVAQAAAAAANDPAAQAMQQSAAGMIDALAPMLSMLTTSKNLKPEQKADIKQLQGMMQELKTDMASGKKLDNAVFNEKMRRYQALLMKVMASAPAPSSGGPAGPPNAVHLQVPKDAP